MAGRKAGTGTKTSFFSEQLDPEKSLFKTEHALIEEKEKEAQAQAQARAAQTKKEQTASGHNKSGRILLSMLQPALYPIDYLLALLMFWVLPKLKQCKNVVVPGSPCLLMAGGRVSEPPSWRPDKKSASSNKIFHAYTLIALLKFGVAALCRIPTNKNAQSLVISHICGVRDCCNADHLILEPKWLNDLRTHCHTILQSWLLRVICPNPIKAFQECCCLHFPACCTHLNHKSLFQYAEPQPLIIPDKLVESFAAIQKKYAASTDLPRQGLSSKLIGVPGLRNMANLGTKEYKPYGVFENSQTQVISIDLSRRLATAVQEPESSLTAYANGSITLESIPKVNVNMPSGTPGSPMPTLQQTEHKTPVGKIRKKD